MAQSRASQNPTGEEIRANGCSIRHLMRQSRAQGARVMLFPEGALSGYPCKTLMSAHHPEATPQIGPADWRKVDWPVLQDELEQVARLAGELKLWTVLGSVHRLTPPNRPHNSLYVFSDTGALVDRYDKRLLSHTELSWLYTPGTAPTVFDVDGFRFGCALCIEVNFAEVFLEYEKLGVDCVLLSAYASDPMFGLLAQGHAAANSYWLGLSVPAGLGDTLPAGIAAPNGEWLARAPRDGTAAVVVVDLDTSAPSAEEAVTHRRPWRRRVRAGSHEHCRVDDLRSRDKTQL